MRFYYIILFCLLLIGCVPESTPHEFILKDLTITQITAPASVPRLQPININIRMSGPDQCYRFSHFEIMSQNMLLHDVRAKASYPHPERGSVVCAPAVYTKDTTLTIQSTVAGSHIFRFYNGPVLFKADTVQVN